jgi:hypothetical protein
MFLILYGAFPSSHVDAWQDSRFAAVRPLIESESLSPKALEPEIPDRRPIPDPHLHNAVSRCLRLQWD